MEHLGNGIKPVLSPLMHFATTCALILFAGCGGSYSGESEYDQMMRGKKDFADLIKSAGGSAEEKEFKGYGQEGMAWHIDLSNGKINDDLIDSLGELDYIVNLNLSNSNITDKQLLQLDTKSAIKVTLDLDLSGTKITSAAFDKLENFNCLKNVKLKGSKVTKQAVTRFVQKRQGNEKVPDFFKKPKFTW